MKRIVVLSGILVVLLVPRSLGQTKSEIRTKFTEAEMFVLFEEYQDALPLYLELLQLYPGNSNFKYRIGQCYLNTPGEKEKAIDYLEEAVNDIDDGYKEGRLRETGAPYDALYYLANAYRINNDIDKALATYDKFSENMDPAVYDTTIIRLQIESCNNAKKLMSIPVFVKEKNLGGTINERFAEFNPVISKNENTIFYSKGLQFYDAIFYSTKENGEWSGPVNLSPDLGIDEDYYPSSISDDGTELYLYRTDSYDGNIYKSQYENGRWGIVSKLNDNINTKYWESHASISHDGRKLFFTSNRKGGFGGLDIYVSERDSTGDWGPAVNLGSVINTPFNEDTPFTGKEDKTLFFSSRGHFNIGGYDVFYSTFLDNGEWSVPLNVGYPLNTTDDDLFFTPVNDGYEAYFSRYAAAGFGDQDIFRVELFTEDHPRKFYVTGIARIKDLLANVKDSVKISIFNMRNMNEPIIVYSDPLTGEYQFEVQNGVYEITFEADGTEKITKTIDFLLTNPSDSFLIPGTVLPKADFSADLDIKSNQTISVATGDTIEFPISAEPNSILTIEHWKGDSIIATEQFSSIDSLFIYKTVPLPGEDRISFKLTDRFGNTTTSDVYLDRTDKPVEEKVVRPEYSRIIADRQIDALKDLLISRQDGSLQRVIQSLDTDNTEFATVDDLITYIKNESAKKNISAESVDKLALKVAVTDNILSQAAIDILARNATGELQSILSTTDINTEGLKSWTDLQDYVLSRSEGRITAEDLNSLAAGILADRDPAISTLGSKALIVAVNAPSGDKLIKAVSETNSKNLKQAGDWLNSLYEESVSLGITDREFADILTAMVVNSSEDLPTLIGNLIHGSNKNLANYLGSLDLKKNNIKTVSDLIYNLLSNTQAGNYTKADLFDALAGLSAVRDLPGDIILNQSESLVSRHSKLLWILPGLALLLFLFLLIKRRKHKK